MTDPHRTVCGDLFPSVVSASGPGGTGVPDIALGNGYGWTVTNDPGDVIVMSAECREFTPETFNVPCLNKICVSGGMYVVKTYPSIDPIVAPPI